jgi:hypothetical protein
MRPSDQAGFRPPTGYLGEATQHLETALIHVHEMPTGMATLSADILMLGIM